jgi:hypothetical protein
MESSPAIVEQARSRAQSYWRADDDLTVEPASPGPKISLLGVAALALAAYAAFLALVSLVGLRPIAVVLGAAGLFSTLYGAAKLLIYMRQNRRPVG